MMELAKVITEASRDNNEMAKSVLGKVVVDEAKNLYEEMNSFKTEFITINAEYTVDRNDPEDFGWEGAKERETFSNLGFEVLKTGAFKRSKKDIGTSKETVMYSVLIVNQERL